MNTNKISWNDSISVLNRGGKANASSKRLQEAGYHTLSDLISILPLHIQKVAASNKLSELQTGDYIKGSGSIRSQRSYPQYQGKGRPSYGKNRVQLFRCEALVRSDQTGEDLPLVWFNAYPNITKKLKEEEHLYFFGQIKDNRGIKQIVNPKLFSEGKLDLEDTESLAQYPTINQVSGVLIHKYIQNIPVDLWDHIPDPIPQPLQEKDHLYPKSKAFKILHGRIEHPSKQDREEAKNRLIYEEFFEDQIKFQVRRLKNQILKSTTIQTGLEDLQNFASLFPYELTQDQRITLEEIQEDFKRGTPMMRMVQGDVGCGKTSVAFIASMLIAQQNLQVALMAPTEALAQQHFETFNELLVNHSTKTSLLLGSTKSKDKKKILEELEKGDIQILIGTHSLFQDQVQFHNLTLVIIDEQHKFGVEQRLRLVQKGSHPHTLLMSATPIPRSLSLAQYGDLDISIIKTMPRGRKGVQTRVVLQENYTKYLSFLRTRLDMQEQAYVVTPAIEDNPEMDLKNVETTLTNYQKAYPQFQIAALHGKLKADEKEEILKKFMSNQVQILISTSVVEVGINNPNATIMAIYNPERFGLSSLHQLRGRVGRSDKPGFCFLLCDDKIGRESLDRIKIIEKTTDGFVIAHKDLEIRGEGDVFGVSQSGDHSKRRMANFITHASILEKVCLSIAYLEKEYPDLLKNLISCYTEDDKVAKTV